MNRQIKLKTDLEYSTLSFEVFTGLTNEAKEIAFDCGFFQPYERWYFELNGEKLYAYRNMNFKEAMKFLNDIEKFLEQINIVQNYVHERAKYFRDIYNVAKKIQVRD